MENKSDIAQKENNKSKKDKPDPFVEGLLSFNMFSNLEADELAVAKCIMCHDTDQQKIKKK